MDEKDRPVVFIDPDDPGQSVADNLAKNAALIKLIEEDDGKAIALDYHGNDPVMMSYIFQKQSYVMLRRAPDDDTDIDFEQTPKLSIVDYYFPVVKTLSKPTLLEKFLADGFRIAGMIDNHYTDVFGLVQPDALVGTHIGYTLADHKAIYTQRTFFGKSFILPREAGDAYKTWLKAPIISGEEAKQPYLQHLYHFRKELEAMQPRATLDTQTKGQKPPMN